MMQGGAGLSKDLPPFTIARGNNGICGLNSVGLRRAGFTAEERLELRRLYHLVFRSGKKWAAALEEAKREARFGPGRQLVQFLGEGKRGFCADVSRRRGSEESG